MKPTKAQKLAWIERAMTILPHSDVLFTCIAFGNQGERAGSWYASVLEGMKLEPRASWLFVEIGSSGTNRAKDARLLWLSFLHLWVSSGEVE